VRVAAGISLAIAATVAITGCKSSGPSAESPSPDDAFTQLVEMQIGEAKAANASDSQIAALEAARTAGVMTHEAAMNSFNEYVDCLDAAGIRWELEPDSRGGDFPPIRMTFYADDPAIADACSITYYEFVDIVYQVQPAAQQAEADTLEAYRDEILHCLDEHGVEIDASTTNEELHAEVLALFFGYVVDDPETMRPGGEFDCLGPLGLDPSDI
jgi:hypothetical protein